jgi:hypothetical protein
MEQLLSHQQVEVVAMMLDMPHLRAGQALVEELGIFRY